MVERGDGVARGGRAEGGCTVQRGGVRSGRGIREGVVEEVIATGDEIRGWVGGVSACGGAIHSWLGHAALIQKGVVRMGVFIASPYIVVHHHNVHGLNGNDMASTEGSAGELAVDSRGSWNGER